MNDRVLIDTLHDISFVLLQTIQPEDFRLEFISKQTVSVVILK